MAAVIEIQDLVKDYRVGEMVVHVLKGISFEIERGDFVSIMGPSGSGKSTLMNILGCLDKPTSGAYTLDGISVGNLNRDQLAEIRNNKIGFVFQSYSLIPVLSAIENVEFILRLLNVPRGDREARAREVLREVGLEGLEARRPSRLSGGQQQRVAVARALAPKPSIVLADDPTANLDSKNAGELIALMGRLNASSGITFLIATHDARVIAHSRRQIEMTDGRISGDQRRDAPIAA